MVERAVCLSCGEPVLARVDASRRDLDGRPVLICPDCGATWNSNRPPWGAAQLIDASAPELPQSYLEPLRVMTYVDQRNCVVAAEGDIDLLTAPAFEVMTFEGLGVGRDHLVVDLSKVRFIDSSGVAVLVVLRRQAHASMTRVAVVCSPIVRKVLEMAGLHTVFDVFESVDAALA